MKMVGNSQSLLPGLILSVQLTQVKSQAPPPPAPLPIASWGVRLEAHLPCSVTGSLPRVVREAQGLEMSTSDLVQTLLGENS